MALGSQDSPCQSNSSFARRKLLGLTFVLSSLCCRQFPGLTVVRGHLCHSCFQSFQILPSFSQVSGLRSSPGLLRKLELTLYNLKGREGECRSRNEKFLWHHLLLTGLPFFGVLLSRQSKVLPQMGLPVSTGIPVQRQIMADLSTCWLQQSLMTIGFLSSQRAPGSEGGLA